MWRCKKCNHEYYDNTDSCWICGREKDGTEVVYEELKNNEKEENNVYKINNLKAANKIDQKKQEEQITTIDNVNINKASSKKSNNKTKVCPYCAETIKEAAIVCRFCGRDLIPSKPKIYKYCSFIYNYRNIDEAEMWLKAEGNPANQAMEYFWNELKLTIDAIDDMVLSKYSAQGWEIAPPRDSSCIKINCSRNSKGYNLGLSIVSAVMTSGASLIGNAIGYQKWWPQSFILRYKKEASEFHEKKYNFFINQYTKEFDMHKQNPYTLEWNVLGSSTLFRTFS